MKHLLSLGIDVEIFNFDYKCLFYFLLIKKNYPFYVPSLRAGGDKRFKIN